MNMKKTALLTLAIFAFANSSASSVAAQSSPCDWSGEWETSRGVLTLSQSGATMTGTSTEFGGITAMSYRGQKWCELYGVYRDDSTQKQGEFKLLQNGDSFTGKWQAHKGRAWAHSWTGTKAPQPITAVSKTPLGIPSQTTVTGNSTVFKTAKIAPRPTTVYKAPGPAKTVSKPSQENSPSNSQANSQNNQTSYKERERDAYRGADYCGPDFLTKYIDSSISGPFLPVCKKHDACYRLGEKSQTFCDNQMKVEMKKICNSKPWYAVASCKTHAAIFGHLIETTIGGKAFGGAPQGRIVKVQRKVINDYFSDDEVDYCVTIHNDSKITQEYEVRLYTAHKKQVDREPDTYEANIISNGRKTICLGTNNSADWSQSDLTSTVYIQLLADTPNSWAVTGDMVQVHYRSARGR